jgi:hypothetical protein
MPVVWCSISAHGFGHAAQVIPILNALGRVVEDLHVILRTCVNSSIFNDYLQVPWELQAIQQDIGCIQRGPLDIDIDGTWAAHEEFHQNWSERVSQEAQAMHEVKPNLVISNISYLAIASAFQVGCPVVAIASLSWDQVLKEFIQPSQAHHQVIYDHIRREYAKANHLIRLYPGIDMPAFASLTDTGPSFPLVDAPAQNARDFLEMKKEEKLILIAFGGVPLSALPLQQMESCEGFHFLVAGLSFDSSWNRIHRVEDIKLSFAEIMKQVDVVMTKPGYATVTTVVHYDIPLVYVRRYNFADEQPLVNYLHQHGRAVEMTREDFESGSWGKTLHAVLDLPSSRIPPPPPEHGKAVSLLENYLTI